MSLRIRVFGLVMASVVPAVGVQLYNEHRHHEERRETVKLEVEGDARRVAAELGRSIEALARTLVAAAHATPLSRGDAEACGRLLADLGPAGGAAGGIVVVDRAGRPACTPDAGVTLAIAERPWFQRALKSGMGLGGYANEPALGGAGVPLAVAVPEAGGRAPLVAIALLDLRALAERVQGLPLPPDSSVTIADGDDTVLVRLPERERVGSRLADGWTALEQARVPGAIEVDARLEGAERIVGYVPRVMAPAGFFVAVGRADDVALAAAWRASGDSLALMVLAVLAAMALSWFVSERLVHRPLDVLAQTARRLRRGELGTRAELAPSDASEFGGLGSTFNELAETLQAREQERVANDEALRRARDEAEAASRSKTHFLAAVSHDLRQPLHSMSLTTDLLRLRLQGRPEAELAERIARSVANLGDLVNAVLDVSQLDAGLIVPQIDDFALDRLLQGTADEFSDEAERKGLDLRVEISPAWVRSDLRLLRRIVHNLVANAVKYTPTGGRVRVRCEVREGHVEICVVDTGRGIPEERQAEIWEEFRQLDNPARDPSKGLGLGLSIVRRMATLLGHPITLRSEVGVGTAVTVVVPMTAARTREAGTTAMPGLHGRLLLVEDDAAVAESTAGLLREWGLEVRVARTAEAAIAAIGEASRPWDAVLTDFRLPGRSGLDVVREARARRAARLVVVMTGDVGANLKEIVPDDVAVLAKPLGTADLAAVLASLARDEAAARHGDGAGGASADASPLLEGGPDGVLQRSATPASTMAVQPHAPPPT